MLNFTPFVRYLLFCFVLTMLESCISISSFKYESFDKGRILVYPYDIRIGKNDNLLWSFGDGSKWRGYSTEHTFKYNGYYNVRFNLKKGIKRHLASDYININNAKDWHLSGDYKEGRIWANFEFEVSESRVLVTNTSKNTDSNSIFELSTSSQKAIFNNDISQCWLNFDWWGIYTITLVAKNAKTGDIDITRKEVDMRHLPSRPVDDSPSSNF